MADRRRGRLLRLSWFDDLPEGDRPAIAMLRELLAIDQDPIDRHFQFAELETRL